MMLGLTDISAGEVPRARLQSGARAALGQAAGRLPARYGRFYDNLTAADNLRYTARLIGFRAAEREKRIAEALERVGLADNADKRVNTFSRGMRQRLGLAEILMKGAQIAILDEPTSGLDPHATAELLGLSAASRPRAYRLLSSHLLERVQSVCDRVALFSAGRIALMGSVPDLGRRCSAAAMSSTSRPTAWTCRTACAIPGVSGVEKTGIGKLRLHADRDVRPEAAAEVVAMQGRLKFLGVQEPSLEAIYTRYFESQARRSRAGRNPPCSVRAQPLQASAWSCSRGCPTT